jgi:hypothetical protein
MKIWTQIGLRQISLLTDADIELFQLEKIMSKEQSSLFMKRLCPLLPGKSYDEVEEHVEWYISYCNLLLQKKVLLQSWKLEMREKMKHAGGGELMEVPTDKSRFKSETEEERIEKKQKVAVWRRQHENEEQVKLV